MKTIEQLDKRILAISVAVCCICPLAKGVEILGWRMDGSGCYPDADPPLHWSVDHNHAWMVPIETDSYSGGVASALRF